MSEQTNPTNQRLREGALTPASSPKQPPAQATLVPLRPDRAIEELVDTACPVCGELPGLAGQQVGNRRYSAICVIFDERHGGFWRPMTREEHPPLPGDPAPPRQPERATDAWHRPLNDGRVEIMCRAPGFRIRVTAPELQAWEAVELFEQWTGLTVRSDRRPRRAQPVIMGQLSMTDMTELELGGNDGTS